jgi:hypothetical protein
LRRYLLPSNAHVKAVNDRANADHNAFQNHPIREREFHFYHPVSGALSMPVPSVINDLSTVVASNSPAGSESPATADDYFRAHAAFIAQLRDKVGVGLAKNKLINGGFLINQRGVSGTVILAAGAYGHDRWKAGASGCTYTFATSAGVTTLTISAGSLQQVIEGANMQGGTHSLSWTGTAQGKIGGGAYSASGVTASATGGANLTIEFNTGTLSLAQLEIGSVSTPFENRPTGQELGLCQRYYQRLQSSNGFFAYVPSAGTQRLFQGQVATKMRATPTATIPSYSVFGVATSASITADSDYYQVAVSASGAGTAGVSTNVVIELTAEL